MWANGGAGHRWGGAGCPFPHFRSNRWALLLVCLPAPLSGGRRDPVSLLVAQIPPKLEQDTQAPQLRATPADTTFAADSPQKQKQKGWATGYSEATEH